MISVPVLFFGKCFHWYSMGVGQRISQRSYKGLHATVYSRGTHARVQQKIERTPCEVTNESRYCSKVTNVWEPEEYQINALNWRYCFQWEIFVAKVFIVCLFFSCSKLDTVKSVPVILSAEAFKASINHLSVFKPLANSLVICFWHKNFQHT